MEKTRALPYIAVGFPKCVALSPASYTFLTSCSPTRRHDPSFVCIKILVETTALRDLSPHPTITLRPKAVLRAQLRAKTLGQLELLAMNMRDEAPQPTAYMKQSGTMVNDTCVHDVSSTTASALPRSSATDFPSSSSSTSRARYSRKETNLTRCFVTDPL